MMYRSNKESFVGLYWIRKILYQINIVKFNLPKKAKYHPIPPANTIIFRTPSWEKFLGPLRVLSVIWMHMLQLTSYVP